MKKTSQAKAMGTLGPIEDESMVEQSAWTRDRGVTISVANGLQCRNSQQPGGARCKNYQIGLVSDGLRKMLW